MMGLEEMWEQGYDGDGMVIAVLDSGMRVTHDAFADYGLAQSPALSRADVEAFSRKGGTKGLTSPPASPLPTTTSAGTRTCPP